MRRNVALGCIAVILLLPCPLLALCQVPQPRLVCAEYFASRVIVEATLVRTYDDESEMDKKAYPDLPPPAYIYSLRVNKFLRGKATQNIIVYEPNDSGRATFDWNLGTEYLLFLFPSSERKGAWALDGCGNSGPLRQATSALAEIGKVKAGGDSGVIQGLTTGKALTDAIPGIHVEAQGAKGRFTAIADGNGKFRIHVPIGQYRVRVVEPGRSFVPADLEYEVPNKINVEPGGCAQVQFVEPGPPLANPR